MTACVAVARRANIQVGSEKGERQFINVMVASRLARSQPVKSGY